MVRGRRGGGERASREVRGPQAALQGQVDRVGVVQGQELMNAGGHTSLIPKSKEGSKREHRTLRREEARKPPPDLIEHRTVTHEMQCRVREASGQAS